MSTVDVQVSVKLRGRAKLPQEPAAPRMPRITRLMALAIKFDDMLKRAEVVDFADIARLGYVTRARLTQIMNLVLLAPAIQDEVLELRDSGGIGTISEREIRPVTRIAQWDRQKVAWEGLKAATGTRRRQA